MLATSDREPFVHRLHAAKQKHLVEMVRSGSIPLRKGMCRAIAFAVSSFCSNADNPHAAVAFPVSQRTLALTILNTACLRGFA